LGGEGRAQGREGVCEQPRTHSPHTLNQKNNRQAPPDDPPAPTPGLNPLLRTPGPPPPAPGAAPPPPTSAAAGGKDDVSIQTTPPTPGPARNSARAVLRGVRISPKKLARFARILPRLGVEDAAAQCAASPTKAAALCAGVLASAAANAAANHGLGGVPLRVLSAVVGRAATPKRAWFHGKGRAGVRRSYRAHLAIEVERAAGRGRGPPLAYVRPISERKLEAARRRWVGVV